MIDYLTSDEYNIFVEKNNNLAVYRDHLYS